MVHPVLVTGVRLIALLLGWWCMATLSFAEPAETRVRDQAVSVAEDIAALSRLHTSKPAARRLVGRGEAILEELHRAMLAPGANSPQKIQLANVVGEIGNELSVGPLVALAHDNPEHVGVRQVVISNLTELPPTPQALALINSVLATESESWLVRRKALVYLGRQRRSEGAVWVDQYIHDSEAELRVAACYLAARLGRRSVLRPMTEMLAAPAEPSLRYALMLGIAELVEPAGFRARIPDDLRSGWKYESALRYVKFRVASDEKRDALAQEMLGSRSLFERHEAARFLLEHRGVDGLASLLSNESRARGNSALIHQLRRARLSVVQTRDGGIRIEPKGRP